MSTFDGRIKEYPTIAIDNFKDIERPKIFILSHTHTAHTRGLENIEFNKKLYCSEKTARILPLAETRKTAQLKYKHLAGYIQPVPYYDPISITTRKHGVVHLTFYPAHHCPGSAMILIEGENGNIFYTGDMRAERLFIREKLGTLQNFAIKNLYIDTTCCYSDRRYFITKEESCKQLIDLIEQYRKYTDPHVYLDNWTTGYEKIWRTIRRHYNSKVHVSQSRYNFYTTLSEKYQDILTIDPNSTRFHSCRWDEGCYKHEKTMISIHLTPNRNKKWMSYNPSKESRKLLQTDLPFGCNPVQRSILPFSTHSSLMEIVDFLKFVKPDKFFSLCGSW